MEDLFLNKEVIASGNTIYGFGRCIAKISDSKYRVALSKGYFIKGSRLININDQAENKIKNQEEFFMELSLNHDDIPYCNEPDVEEKVREYYDMFQTYSSSFVKKGEELVYTFSEDEIDLLDEGCSEPRLIWSENFTKEERLSINGKLLLDPSEYDQCIVGFDENNVYYDIEHILQVTQYIMPDCDPADNVYNNMLPACRYIRSSPYIRFVTIEEYYNDMDYEEDSTDSEEEESKFVTFKDVKWFFIDR